jgi:predicted transcriptional regulator
MSYSRSGMEYWSAYRSLCEDGLRVGGIYEWASRADADRAFTPDWKKFVESKYGTPPVIEYLHSPVMVDNREGTISVAA